MKTKKGLITTLIIICGFLIAIEIVVNANPIKYIPCRYLKIEHKYPWTANTAKEQMCILEQEVKQSELRKKYVIEDSKNWPVYLNKKLGVSFKYPTEGQKVYDAYPLFKDWVTSGGLQNANWYLNK